MMLKQLNRAAKTAWCPDSQFGTFMVSGTVAGSYNENFETQSQLEIYDANLATASLEMRCMGTISSKDTFHSLAWGVKGISDHTFPCGLIAGGMSTGAVALWDAASIVRYKGEKKEVRQVPLVCRVEGHKNAVVGLDFHPQQANVLASTSLDGSVLVWDLKNPLAPTFKPPSTKGTGGQRPASTCCQWNKKVPQILASSNAHGETTIWDLRKSLPIITVKNSFRSNGVVKANGLAWNPDSAVQLGICYNAPVAEIWDLRQMRTGLPLAKLEGGHQGSILSLAWNAHDSDILLSTGDDGRVVCWEPKSGRVRHEYPQQGNINYDLQWCPNMPSILSTCSFEGQVTLQSIQNAGNHVPRWFKRPSGVSFGFGGSIVSFGGNNTADSKATGTTSVNVRQLVTEPQLIDLSRKFQQVVSTNNFEQLCESKVTSSTDANEKTVWKYLGILFQPYEERKVSLLKMLGYDSAVPEPPVASAVQEDAKEQEQKEVLPQQQTLEVPAEPVVNDEDFFNQDFDLGADASGVFEDDPSSQKEEPESPSANADSKETALAKEQAVPEPVGSPEDQAIEKALVVGNFRKAVDLCIESGRMADALVISSFSDDDQALWKETRAKFFTQHKQAFVRDTVRLLVTPDLAQVVDSSSPGEWRKTLAILLTYAKGEEQTNLINRLAASLRHSITSSVICYLCAGNVDAVAAIWARSQDAKKKGGASSSLSLHFAIEKIATFAAAKSGQGQALESDAVSAQYVSYATLLASQGNLSGALDFLQLATRNSQGQVDERTQTLMHRISIAQSQPAAAPAHVAAAQKSAPVRSNARGPANANNNGGRFKTASRTPANMAPRNQPVPAQPAVQNAPSSTLGKRAPPMSVNVPSTSSQPGSRSPFGINAPAPVFTAQPNASQRRYPTSPPAPSSTNAPGQYQKVFSNASNAQQPTTQVRPPMNQPQTNVQPAPVPFNPSNNRNNSMQPVQSMHPQRPQPVVQAAPRAVAPVARARPAPVQQPQTNASPATQQMISTVLDFAASLGASQLTPTEQKKVDKANSELFVQMSAGLSAMDPAGVAIVQNMVNAIQARQMKTAEGFQRSLVKDFFKGNSGWLSIIRGLLMVGKKHLK